MKTEDMTEDQQDELRDQFAMAALQGFISLDTDDLWSHEKLAELAYLQANAMLKARTEE